MTDQVCTHRECECGENRTFANTINRAEWSAHYDESEDKYTIATERCLVVDNKVILTIITLPAGVL
jgi:hypothetical protein